MLPKIAIVGRANVGKSSLFNRIIGSRVSITDDMPGITRDRIYSSTKWLGVEFALIDTGGVELGDAPFLEEIKAQVEIAIDEAHVIVFVTDCRNGITSEDEAVARMLYDVEKPIILAVNKVDDQKFLDNLYEFYSLGHGEPIAVSSAHGVGVGDLLDKIIDVIPKDIKEEYDENVVKFSLIGRPNVGKSSLTNKILGEDRVIVSDIAGTTRDSIDSTFVRNGKEYAVIDTAGIRKKGKVYENAEKYSVIRAMNAIERSDVCLIVLNAEQGIIEQDKHIAGYAFDSNKAIVIVVNKWDTIKKETNTQKMWEENIRSHFQFLSFAPIVFTSALDNKNLIKLFDKIDLVVENYNRRIQTSVLNDIIVDATMMNPPKTHNSGIAKFFYASQVAVKPPTFVFFVNDKNYIHFSYKRYLINQIRRVADYEGVPINLVFRRRD